MIRPGRSSGPGQASDGPTAKVRRPAVGLFMGMNTERTFRIKQKLVQKKIIGAI